MYILMIIMAVLSAIYYFTCMFYAGIKSSFIWFWIIVACMFAVFAICEKNMLKMNHLICDFYKLCRFMMIIGILVMSLLAGLVVSRMNEKTEENLDYVIVLGAQVRGDRITKSLRRRLDAAYDYAVNNPKTTIIVSGGQGPGENLSEALAMRNYLVEKGIKDSRIIMEDKSTTTKENLLFSKEYIKEDASVGIATNGFHVYRAVEIAKKLGYENVCGIAAPTDRILWINYVARECLALIKEKITGNI